MKLTDEKILELAISSRLAHRSGSQYIPAHWPDASIGLELVNFARAILKAAGVEELERDAERFEPCAWMSISEKRFFDNGASAFVSPSGSFTRSDGIVLYKKAK